MPAISGRPDGRLAKFIYAGGEGGVIDWRLPAVANDSPEEAAKVEAKVENGTYRGLEKLVWTSPQYGGVVKNTKTANAVYNATNAGGTIQIEGTVFDSEKKWKDQKTIAWYLVGDNGKALIIPRLANILTDYMYVGYGGYSTVYLYSSFDYSTQINDLFPNGTEITYMALQETDLSVSGEFNTQMIIGDPVNILQTDALKDGWLGTWCPVIPDGTNKNYPLTRKCLDSSIPHLWTLDNGVTWGFSSKSVDTVTNTINDSLVATGLIVDTCTAYAKVTKPSTNKPVYNAKAGLMPVLINAAYDANPAYSTGVLLGESLIGKISTSNSSTRRAESVWLSECYVRSGKIIDDTSIYYPTHVPLTLTAPNNNSPAVKVLPYQISNNGQASIGYQANELTWGSVTATVITSGGLSAPMVIGETYKVANNANSACMDSKTYRCVRASGVGWDSAAWFLNTKGEVCAGTGPNLPFLVPIEIAGWGDDDKIKITASGSDTFVDLNGNTNLSVVHELAIPYTWTSNHARAGEQVEGVDL